MPVPVNSSAVASRSVARVAAEASEPPDAVLASSSLDSARRAQESQAQQIEHLDLALASQKQVRRLDVATPNFRPCWKACCNPMAAWSHELAGIGNSEWPALFDELAQVHPSTYSITRNHVPLTSAHRTPGRRWVVQATDRLHFAGNGPRQDRRPHGPPRVL